MASSRVGAPNRREAVILTGGFFASGALGFVLLAVMARWLTPGDYAGFLALWGAIFAFGSILGAVEQEISRQAAHATLTGGRVPVGAVQTIGLTTAAGLVLLVVLLATPAGRTLTAGSWVVAALTFAAIGGFAVLILSRGIFVGRHEIGLYVTILVGEATLRLTAAALLLLLDVRPSIPWAAVAVVVGCFPWLPFVLRLRSAVDWRSEPLPWGRVAGTVTALAAANGFSALVLTGFPALATLVVGQVGELADLFAVVTLSRVPLVLLAPVQALVVPVAVRWIRLGQLGRLRRALLLVGLGGVLAAVAAGLVGYEIGPWATRLLMGDQYAPGALTCALVLAATVLVASALLQAGVLVALERPWHLTASWLVAVVVAVVLMVWLPVSPEERALWGFVSASVIAQAATGIAVAWCARRAARDDVPV